MFMPVNNSAWISFLRQYGPIPKNDAMYDESIQRMFKKKRIKPINIESLYLPDLIENFKSSESKSVILTGTAGDGKTYHCRAVWSALNGSPIEWDDASKVKHLQLGQTTLHIIKDLSELSQNGSDDIEHFVKFCDSLLEPNSKDVFLIAANDGQLLDALRQVASTESLLLVKEFIEELLVSGKVEIENFRLKMYNLSRISAQWAFPRIVQNLFEHEGWIECDTCSFKDNDSLSQRCPIWENKRRLEGEYNNHNIHSRLVDLLTLCEVNGFHVPIRQLLLLVSNMILGHPAARDNIMNCKDIPKILGQQTISDGSIYRNIFGENLSERRRESRDIFSMLGRFGIGNESTNKIDNILIFGADDPELNSLYEKLVLEDSYYGADPRYRAQQKAYLEGTTEDEGKEFLSQVRSQRQRLFFEIPDSDSDELKLWNLTTFQYAGEFLNDVYRVALIDGKVSSHITSRLVRGLNRIFTGLLTKTQEELFLATSGSNSQAKVSKFFEASISVPRKRGESVSVIRSGAETALLQVSLSNSPNVPPIHLELNLIRYEFLCRVADGALPGSFSKECYEDILAFKSRILTQLQKRRIDEYEDEASNTNLTFQIIKLTTDGMLERKTVEVNI